MKCEICSEDTTTSPCFNCLRVVRCLLYIETHKLCSCGDAWCVHNTNERKAKADRLEEIAKLAVAG